MKAPDGPATVLEAGPEWEPSATWRAIEARELAAVDVQVPLDPRRVVLVRMGMPDGPFCDRCARYVEEGEKLSPLMRTLVSPNGLPVALLAAWCSACRRAETGESE